MLQNTSTALFALFPLFIPLAGKAWRSEGGKMDVRVGEGGGEDVQILCRVAAYLCYAQEVHNMDLGLIALFSLL